MEGTSEVVNFKTTNAEPWRSSSKTKDTFSNLCLNYAPGDRARVRASSPHGAPSAVAALGLAG